MKTLTVCLFMAAHTLLWSAEAAKESSGYESQATLQYEYIDFSGSRQKEDGNRWTLGLKHKEGVHLFQAAAEKTDTNTYQPPLKDNLDVTKLYFKYEGELAPRHLFTANFITIWDNMVPTDNGNIYGLGYAYRFAPKAFAAVNGYFSDYEDFDVYQVDLRVGAGRQIGGVDASAELFAKSIFVESCTNVFCANADSSYFAPGFKLKAQKNGYFVHAAALFGKRVFAVLQDGMMVQHHAMEFTDTYMVGIGKRWERFELKFRYAYQKATELPLNNEGVIVRNYMVRVGYSF